LSSINFRRPKATLKAVAALNIAEKITSGNFTLDYQTPAKVYGADLVLEIDRLTREDA
jgi:hypothetical protein